jgi:hypothetical protein
MTDKEDPRIEPVDEEAEQDSVRSILHRTKIRRTPEVDLLPGVQRRIRERSRGRFYGDGWSRRGSATSTYVVTCLLMLVILVLVYFVLVPSLEVK